MFRNILVPTDLTEKSLKAIEIAAGMGKGKPCHITLLHVVETIEDDEGDEFREFYDKIAARAEKNMAKIARRYETDNIKIHTDIIYGRRVHEIVKYASVKGIDLIILSSHKLNEMESNDGWATISYRVGILAPCPVMMVK
ncbi:MAG: universal stress protein [Desulfatiglans sp.]|jgi:universal stress protein A|nr:universal stress protein [Desulfatiglans sp.]